MASTAIIPGTQLGSQLQQLLMSDDMVPGTDLSYQLAKIIYLWHPLGAKMARSPVKIAMSQERKISIPAIGEEKIRKQFALQWQADHCNLTITNAMTLARVYGITAVVMGTEGQQTSQPIDRKDLAGKKIFFNVVDPLNTSGSLVLDLRPNESDFLKPVSVAVAGQPYHPSRAVVLMNEEPVYLAYTTSAFGYVGRSVYQRALYPLKSFIQSMVTDDMVTRKAGLLIAKIKQAGSIIDNLLSAATGIKRSLLNEAQTNQTLSIDPEEDIQTLNMQNVDGAAGFARGNILKNIATASDMPAFFLENETLTEGFGEGTEDAKNIAQYIDGMRVDMQPIFDFLDPIVMARAWTPEFFDTMKAEFPDAYRGKSFTQAFMEWSNAFHAEWPSLLKEPESEAVKTEETKHKMLISTVQVLLPELDPLNRASLLTWFADNLNKEQVMFSTPLELDPDGLMDWQQEQAERKAEMEDASMAEPEEPPAKKPKTLSVAA